ncbi:13107_t:CDS:2, partial [Gigaspora rosea]
MNKKSSNRKTLQKRKERENETVHQREARLVRDRENKCKKKAVESTEEREARLIRDCERKRKKPTMSRSDESNVATSSATANISVVNANVTNVAAINVESNNVPATNFESTSAATTINEDKHKRLKKFHSKMNKLKHVHCLTCNEYFLSIVLVNGKCRRCHTEKTEPKKFSIGNNMDPGEVPEELKDLIEIEEMLISQVFTVMLPQLQTDEDSSNKDSNDGISSTFVPFLPSVQREDTAINNTIERVQAENPIADWPQIDNNPVNEFQIPGYIARAFP